MERTDKNLVISGWKKEMIGCVEFAIKELERAIEINCEGMIHTSFYKLMGMDQIILWMDDDQDIRKLRDKIKIVTDQVC